MPLNLSTVPRRTVVLRWIAVTAWMLLIFALSSVPDFDPSGSGKLRFDVAKAGHLLVFGVLGVLLAHAMSGSGVVRRRWWAWVALTGYAIVDELHQAFVPGRTPGFLDVVIDAVGGFAGIYLWGKARHWDLNPPWFLRGVLARSSTLRTRLAAARSSADRK